MTALGTMALGTMALGTMALGMMALGTMALGTMALGTTMLGRSIRFVLGLAGLGLLAGCGGGMPLMHTAHPVAKGDVTFGAGFSGTARASATTGEGLASDAELLEAGAVSPGLAPWLGARVGFGAGYDAGMIYAGRSVRVDGRRAFPLSPTVDLSVGLAGSGLLPQRRDALGLRVGGFGGELPVLVGWRSTGSIYSAWLGVRGGAEVLRGARELVLDPAAPGVFANEAIAGWHAYTGGLVGLRIGFRHVFAVLEVDAAMHWAAADVAGRRVALEAFAVAPAGALVARF